MGEPSDRVKVYVNKDSQPYYDFDWEFYYERAEESKCSGNVSYKDKRFKDAIKAYHQGLLDVEFAAMRMGTGNRSSKWLLQEDYIKFKDDQKIWAMHGLTKLRDTMHVCFLNIAACQLEKEKPNFQSVRMYCDMVLAEDENNLKALSRKGQACFHLREFEASVELLERVKLLSNGKADERVRFFLDNARKQLQLAESNHKRLLKSMFTNYCNKLNATEGNPEKALI